MLRCYTEGALEGLLWIGVNMRGRIATSAHVVGPTLLALWMSACSQRSNVAQDADDESDGVEAGIEAAGKGRDARASSNSNDGDARDAGGELTSRGTHNDDSEPSTSHETGAENRSFDGPPDGGVTSADGTGFVPEEAPLPTPAVVEPDPIDVNVAPDTPGIAVNLARFIWRTAPDATTVDLARRGKLVSAAEVYEEAQRLLADPKSDQGFKSFFGAWTEVSRSEELQTSGSGDGGVADTVEYVAAVQTELYDFALDVVKSEGKFRDLLLLPFELDEAALSTAFGGEPTTSRAGLLTQPFLLAAGAYGDRTSPSRRGAFIARRLLCQDLTPDEHTLHGDVPSDVTVREWIVGKTNERECTSCHAVIDPLGFAFEAFDQWGRARTEDKGREVDTSTTLTALGLGQVREPRDIGLELLAHSDVMPCFLSHWFTYALQRPLGEGDLQSWVTLERGAEFYSLREIPALIASSYAFRAQVAQ